MAYDLFSCLFKYKENTSNSPLENYLTEQFAYILEYLVEQKNEIIYDLFKLFDIPLKNTTFLFILFPLNLFFFVIVKINVID